jgi:peptidoglycan hydrolase FlgJ
MSADPVRGAAGSARGAGAAVPRDDRAELRRAAHALEGVFTAQLLQAMRASVPKSGLLDEDPGRDLFESLLDERLAAVAAERNPNGVGELLYRQLERHLSAGKDEPSR